MKRLPLYATSILGLTALSSWLLLRDTAHVELAAGRLIWPADVRSIYAVKWRTETEGLAIPEQSNKQQHLDMESELAGEVAIEPIDRSLVAVSFAKVERLDMRMQGKSAGTLQPQTLEGYHAYVSYSPRGEVTEIRYDDNTAVPVRQALRGLVTQLQLTLPESPADKWEAAELVGGGEMRQRYAVDGADVLRRPLALVRVDSRPGALDGTQVVDGKARFHFADGALASIADEGAWSYTQPGQPGPASATRFNFSFQRVRSESLHAAQLRAALPVRPGEPLAAAVTDEGLAGRRDKRLSEGLTDEALMKAVDHFQKGQRSGQYFVVRAGAYLRLHPEAAKLLVARFQDAETSYKGRGFLLDMLVQAGDANAQQAMRDALTSQVAHARSGEYGILVQRFTLLDIPRPESARFLEGDYQQSLRTGDLRAAAGAASTLGAVARKLAAQDQPELAQQIHALLVSELKSADSVPLERALLAGLGNEKRADDAGVIAGFARAGDPLLRAEVASALRGIDDPAGRKTLLDLVGDGDAIVAISAVASLGEQTLSSSDWGALSSLVTGGRTHLSSDARLVRMIRENRAAAGADGDAMLRALLPRNQSGENTLGSEIQTLLAGR